MEPLLDISWNNNNKRCRVPVAELMFTERHTRCHYSAFSCGYYRLKLTDLSQKMGTSATYTMWPRCHRMSEEAFSGTSPRVTLTKSAFNLDFCFLLYYLLIFLSQSFGFGCGRQTRVIVVVPQKFIAAWERRLFLARLKRGGGPSIQNMPLHINTLTILARCNYSSITY